MQWQWQRQWEQRRSRRSRLAAQEPRCEILVSVCSIAIADPTADKDVISNSWHSWLAVSIIATSRASAGAQNGTSEFWRVEICPQLPITIIIVVHCDVSKVEVAVRSVSGRSTGLS